MYNKKLKSMWIQIFNFQPNLSAHHPRNASSDNAVAYLLNEYSKFENFRNNNNNKYDNKYKYKYNTYNTYNTYNNNNNNNTNNKN